MEGFYYDPNAPLVLDNSNLRTGVGTTAAGVFISLNPDSPIDNKSPYVKDCTCFSDPATESGRFGGGGVGVFIDGGVHDKVRNQWCSTPLRTLHLMVLDSFLIRVQSLKSFPVSHTTLSGVTTQVVDQESGVLVVTTLMETMVLSHLVSQLMKFQELQQVFGDMASVQGVTKAGTVAIGATMFGQTSKASAWFLNDQITADKIYFKYQPGYGNAGIGTTGFVDGEIIWFGAGAEASSGVGSITVGAAASSVTGQKGTIMEVDNISSSLLVGDAIGFTTTLYGATDRFFIINTITNVAAAVTYQAWQAGSTAGVSTVYYNRATLTISPEKGTGTWDTRGLGSGNGSSIEVQNSVLTGKTNRT